MFIKILISRLFSIFCFNFTQFLPIGHSFTFVWKLFESYTPSVCFSWGSRFCPQWHTGDERPVRNRVEQKHYKTICFEVEIFQFFKWKYNPFVITSNLWNSDMLWKVVLYLRLIIKLSRTDVSSVAYGHVLWDKPHN